MKAAKPCVVCHNFNCPFMARIRSYDLRRHLRSPFALSREHGMWSGDEWSGMGLEDSLDLLVKFKNYYDKPPELTDYEAERQQQKQDLAKEREVKNLKLQKHNKMIYIYICAPHSSLLTKALSTPALKSVANN